MSTCINPIVNYIEQIIAISENQSISIPQAFADNKFLPITVLGACELGCSDLYIIAPMRFNNGNNAIEQLYGECGYVFNNPCCFNYELQSYQDYPLINNIRTTFGETELLTCCNSFNKCTEDYYELITAEYQFHPNYNSGYYKKGLFEFNTLNGDSGLCDLLEFLKTLPTSPVFPGDILQEVLDQFLSDGFVAYYDSATSTLYAGTVTGFCLFINP
jgi:hypothetical protein